MSHSNLGHTMVVNLPSTKDLKSFPAVDLLFNISDGSDKSEAQDELFRQVSLECTMAIQSLYTKYLNGSKKTRAEHSSLTAEDWRARVEEAARAVIKARRVPMGLIVGTDLDEVGVIEYAVPEKKDYENVEGTNEGEEDERKDDIGDKDSDTESLTTTSVESVYFPAKKE